MNGVLLEASVEGEAEDVHVARCFARESRSFGDLNTSSYDVCVAKVDAVVLVDRVGGSCTEPDAVRVWNA